jgi:hypothetical protein
MRLHAIDPSDWPAVAAKFHDLTFEQTKEYTEAAAARICGRMRYVAFEENGTTVAAAALRVKTVPGLGRGIAWCPSGPLLLPHAGGLPDSDRVKAVLATLRNQIALQEGHILRVRLSGLSGLPPEAVAQAAAAAGFSRGPGHAYRSIALDLSQDDATLMRHLDGKWRTDLRFAQKSGLGLDHGTGPHLEARFMAMFEATKAQKGFQPDISPHFHFALDGPGYSVETMIATHGGQDLAGIVVGYCPGSATYLFGATAPSGRHLRPGYFLQWAAMGLARARGCLWYDLGGIDSGTNPDVTRFKTRMNGVPLFAEVWQTGRPGIVTPLLLKLERLRQRRKRQ